MIDDKLEQLYGDFNEELNKLYYILPLDMYEKEDTVLTSFSEDIPSELPYSLLPNSRLYLKSINGRLCKTEVPDIQFDSTVALRSGVDLEEIPYGVSRHGNGVLLERASLDSLDVRLTVQDKSANNMSHEIKLALGELYYYLYINDMNSVYGVIRRLSEFKRNNINKNKKTKIHRSLAGIKVIGRTLRYVK